MPDGEWTELIAGLEFDTWGMGLAHMAAQSACGRCEGTGLVGDPSFPIYCPDCIPRTAVGD